MEHSERSHAFLSASGAHRWLNCTISPSLEQYEPEETSTYAEEGTTAHEYAELLILKATNAERPIIIEEGLDKIRKGKWYNSNFEEAVQDYVSYVLDSSQKAKNYDPFALISTETKSYFDEYVPGGFGTVDHTIIASRIAKITDLKFGKGVQVDATDNDQLKLYALGVYQMYGKEREIDKFSLVIHQPRLQNISSFTITTTELLNWANTVVVPKAQEALYGIGKFKSGDWCRFCKIKHKCPVLLKEFQETEKLISKPLNSLSISDKESVMKYVLEKGDRIKKWINEVERMALLHVLDGKPLEGYKAVAGRSMRTYTNPNAIASMLEAAGYAKEDIYNNSLKSITQIEKLVGKKTFNEAFSTYVEKPEGKPTLTRIDDKREELNDINDFEVLT